MDRFQGLEEDLPVPVCRRHIRARHCGRQYHKRHACRDAQHGRHAAAHHFDIKCRQEETDKERQEEKTGNRKNLIFFLPHTRQKITGSFPVPLLFYDFHYFVVRTGYGAFPCIGLEAHK